ncbi:B-box zinc finger protein [Candidatus Fermentibacteria bacterium]|nr:B-box zinc finger protein [Candidatus Fermentibacteria bacterium]
MILDSGSEDWEQQSVRLIPAAEPPPAVGPTLPPGSKQCHYHPGTIAPFLCTACGKLLCEECAPDRLMSGELVRFCAHCGGMCTDVEEDAPSAAAAPAPGSTRRSGSIRKPPPPPPMPEPPPTDHQLFSILVYPFAGLGAVWLLAWGVFNFVAWPVALLFFIPYLWALYLAAEHERPRPPAPWSLGGGPGLIAGRLMKLMISPGLLVVLLYVVLVPSGEPAPSGEAQPSASYSGILSIALLVALAGLIALMPLIIAVLFRTGSPFMSLDPTVLFSLIRRSPSRYMACLVSLVVLVGFGLGVYLLLAMIPFPRDLPGIEFIQRPGPAAMLAGMLALIWAVTALGRYGRWVSWCLDEE